MSAPAYGSKSTVSAGLSTTRTLVTPASTAKNNLVLAVIEIKGAAVTVEPPSGWTLVKSIHIGAAEEHTLAVLSKVATEGGEVPVEVKWGGAERFNSGYTVRFTGEHQSVPVEASATKANEAASKSMTFPKLTTGQKETLSILIGGEGIEGEASATPPAGWTTRQTISEGCPYMATGEAAAAGEVPEKVVTLGTSRETSCIHLIIAPEEVPVEKVFELPPRLGPAGVNGTIFYIDTVAGADLGGTGAKGNPYKTLGHAMSVKSAANPNGIFELLDGAYPEEELLSVGGTADKPTLVRAAPGASVKFEWSGSGFEHFRVSECDYIRFERIEFAENHGEANVNVYNKDGSHHLEYYRCIFHDGQRSNLYTNSSTTFIQAYNCISFRAGRRQEETHNLDHGFYMDGAPVEVVGHAVVNCLAFDNDATGVSPHEHTSQFYCVNTTSVYNGRSGVNLGGDMTESYVINVIACFNGVAGEGYGIRDAGTAHGNFVRNVISYGNATANFRNANPGYVLGAHLEVDPEFVDAAGKDFRLKPGSPAIGYGDADWAPSFDLNLTGRRVAATIGCYEIGSAPIPEPEPTLPPAPTPLGELLYAAVAPIDQ